MEVRLSDLIYTYPPQDDPDFQTIITAKREFSELASNVTEPVPAPGYLYKHQELIKRFMIVYDRLLLMHRAGTGKTCTVFGSAEAVKLGILEGAVNFVEDYIKPQRTNIKRIYILTRGPLLIEELRRQLICVCTPGTYLTPPIINATTDQQRKVNITKTLDPYYTIQTYTTFVHSIRDMTDQQMKDNFSDTMIVVDEVQNVRSDLLTTTKEEGHENYTVLHRLFHLIERSKIILASATPMINSTAEIADVMNLILPLDRQMNFSDYDNLTLNQVEPYFRGMVSYVRELDTGIVPIYEGALMGGEYQIAGRTVASQSIIYPSTMEGIQRQAYETTQDEASNFYSSSRHASNFVFPDGSYNKAGFERYVRKIGSDQYYPNEELLDYIQGRNSRYLEQLSSKLVTMLNIAIQQPGSTFIYCNFLHAGGAALIGAVLNGIGIEQFLGNKSPFVGVEGGLKPVCGSSGQGRRTINIDPNLRFALLTSETPAPRGATIQDLFNSYQNRHGEYLKILIGSPVSKVGLNLANVVQIHLFDPAWNQSHNYQAISRAIRTTSHVTLLSEAKKNLIEQGLNPDGARVEVRIYQHASILSGGSIDLDMYAKAESKDIAIRTMERMMKQVAFDCQIQYNRNVRSVDVDYSPACDYDVCRYSCGLPPTDRQLADQASYNLLYSGRRAEVNAQQIAKILASKPIVTLSQLEGILNLSLTEILLALEELISNKTVVTDRYGFEGFVGLDGDTIFVQRDYPLTLGRKSGAYYIDNLIAIKKLDLNQYIDTLEAPQQAYIIEQIRANPTRFDSLVAGLKLAGKVALLEQALIDYAHGSHEPWIDKVINLFSPYIYHFHEPVSSIESSKSLSIARKNVGRRSAKPKTVNIHSSNIAIPDPFAETDTEIVYLHTLYSQAYDKTSYAVVAKFTNAEGKIRLYKFSEKAFRDANDYEAPVYSLMIQLSLEQRLADYERHEVYGTVLADKIFRIRDRTTENVQESRSDARKINRGKNCETWRKPDLIDLMWHLGIEPPGIVDSGMDDQEAYEYLAEGNRLIETDRVKISELSPERLQFFARWYLSGMDVKNGICKIIQDTLADRDLLLIV